MLLFRLIKLREGRRVGWCAGCTDGRMYGRTDSEGRSADGFQNDNRREQEQERKRKRERETEHPNGYYEVREGRERDPCLLANAWNGTYNESGITIDFLSGDSMHLTSITLFIRGDKQSAEKRRRQPRRTFVPYETFIEHWQASRFSKISPSQRNAAKHASSCGDLRQRIHKLAFRKFH